MRSMESMVARLRDLERRRAARLPGELITVLSPASVLLLLWPEQQTLRLALTARPRHGGPHSGEVSLPGGRVQAEDRDWLGTALRETQEELGVEVPRAAVLGQLDEAWSISHHLVTPWVALLPEPPRIQPCPREVERVLVADVNALLHEETWREREVTAGGQVWQDSYFEVEGELVWGLTSDLILELRDCLRGADGHRAELRAAELRQFLELTGPGRHETIRKVPLPERR